MSKNSDEHKEAVQETPDDLLNKFDQKKEQLIKERKNENPEGRLSGYNLSNMYAAITGQNPFTGGQAVDQGGRPIGFNLDSRKYPDSPLFATKLTKNLKEIRDNLTVIERVLPSLSEEESKRLQKYNKERIEIIKKNTGRENVAQFSEDEINALIKRQGNKEIYDNAIKEIKAEYQEVIDKNQKISKERDEILKKPLAKCEFDKITEKDVSKAGLSVNEQQAIDPMLDY